MSEPLIYYNGVDFATGRFVAPLSILEWKGGSFQVDDEVAREGQRAIRAGLDWRSALLLGMQAIDRAASLGVSTLPELGWGVVFAQGISPAVVEALRPLLQLRRAQASLLDPSRYWEECYPPNETHREFLRRHRSAPGASDAAFLPRHVLLVGSPTEIPFGFQQALAANLAVGRLYFETVEEYAAYAQSVLACERGEHLRSSEVRLIAPRYDGDHSVGDTLVLDPSRSGLSSAESGWQVVASDQRDDASKERLVDLIGGSSTPGLLYFSGHGVAFSAADPRQASHQGALICGDWPGPGARSGPLLDDEILSARDIGPSADVRGMVTFMNACYSAGSPALEQPLLGPQSRAQIPASAPFLSRLAQRLLGHPRGGALAVVGQVGRAFRFSPKWPEDRWRYDAVGVVVRRIMSGEPIGVALHSLRLQAAALGQELVSAAESTALKRSRGATEDLAVLWALHGNFSSFTLLGDPAVRLRTQLDRPYEAEPPQPAYELREPQPAAWIREPSTVPAPIVALPATEAGGKAWDDLIGPFRSESGVAHLLGGVSEDVLARAREERAVLALKTADGAWVFPSFQFEEDGTRVAGLAPILAAFRPDEVDDWMVARWLVTPLKALAGSSVIDWLRAGREQSVVLTLARHMAARFEC